MSESSESWKLELVRRWNKAFSERDPDAFSGLMSADLVYRPVPSFTDSQERRGADGLRRFMLEWWDSWEEDATWELESVRVYGEAVVTLLRFKGRARASGIQTVGGVFQVFRFEAGRISRIEDFTESREAIAAAEARP